MHVEFEKIRIKFSNETWKRADITSTYLWMGGVNILYECGLVAKLLEYGFGKCNDPLDFIQAEYFLNK